MKSCAKSETKSVKLSTYRAAQQNRVQTGDVFEDEKEQAFKKGSLRNSVYIDSKLN